MFDVKSCLISKMSGIKHYSKKVSLKKRNFFFMSKNHLYNSSCLLYIALALILRNIYEFLI